MSTVFVVSGIATAVVTLFSPQKPPAHLISPLAQVTPAPIVVQQTKIQSAPDNTIKTEIIEEKVTPASPNASQGGPTPTESPTPSPTQSSQTTQTSTTPTTQTSQTNTPANSNADVLFALVNNYRKDKNLPAFQKEDRVCSLANSRAPEIAGEMANGTLHSGMYGRNLPYWNTENAIAYGDVQTDFNWWIGDYIHKKAIESDFTYSCTACSGIYCVEEFTSFQPK